ncbi:MAG: hypothetical protein AW10_03275 [Candidatus Accumulibacter appositus]|uniref:Uncharacterized protein n=1 Tax=Candidatus Accumulibacter appositus TaxID=1454003 RepID=A0A011NS71_9PROT|nr:hypothetical protein [Accumulibacter sp.]EXI78191.1 MAG: hypothetical protein AW10_03275 [Candidatus Accumulibacter appositus]HRF04682.1 hypothetical protein [Accumulibacter sp.]
MENEIDPLWHLADTLTVREAAALIAGYDPADIAWMNDDLSSNQDWPRHYPAEASLRGAVLSGAIKSEKASTGKYHHIRMVGEESEGHWEPLNEISATGTRINVDDLREWLTIRGLRTGFFFPTATDTPDYLDARDPRYAPKLAAAVRAWLAVTDTGKTSPKRALVKWLREHAAEFGLSDDEGKPNETGIEEVAKVANWQLGGGAPKS